MTAVILLLIGIQARVVAASLVRGNATTNVSPPNIEAVQSPGTSSTSDSDRDVLTPIIVIITLMVVLLSVCLAMVFRAWRDPPIPPPSEGDYCFEVNGEVEIVHWQVTKTEQGKGQASSDGKIHVAWNTDDLVQRHFVDDLDRPLPPAMDVEDVLMPILANSGPATQNYWWRLFARHGERVEYYSRTCCSWLTADMQIQHSQGSEPRYNVRIHGGSVQEMVAADMVRRPLADLQPVEVYRRKGWGLVTLFSYSLEQHLAKDLTAELEDARLHHQLSPEQWEGRVLVLDVNKSEVDVQQDVSYQHRFPVTVQLMDHTDNVWVPGVIGGPQISVATTQGYRVRVLQGHLPDGEEQVLESVPSVRLRLRYPAGLEVEVYRGWEHGWTTGTVHSSASADGTGMSAAPPANVGTNVVDLRDSTDDPDQASFQLDRWVNVPVVFSDLGIGMDDTPQMMPSYYLRHTDPLQQSFPIWI